MFIKKLLLAIAVLLVLTSVAQAQRVAITRDVANVRSGPGTSHAIVWKAEKYFPFQVVDTQGDWFFVSDFEGDKGWVFKNVVAKIDTVIIRKGISSGNIRAGAGTSHPVVFKANAGTPFKVLKRQGEWINIEHRDGDKGWVHRNLVW